MWFGRELCFGEGLEGGCSEGDISLDAEEVLLLLLLMLMLLMLLVLLVLLVRVGVEGIIGR